MRVGGHAGRLDWHEVHDLGDAAFGQEPCNQDGGIGQVHLPGCVLASGRRQGEPPAAPLI